MSKRNCVKESFSFSRENTLNLIHLYETKTILYDVLSPNYKNKTRRNMAFKEMQTELLILFNINIDVEEIKKKINSLRTQYFSEKNKVSKSMVSGAGADDVYAPSLWSYEHLRFLDQSAPVRKGESNLEVCIETEEEEEEEEDEYDGNIDIDSMQESIHDGYGSQETPISRGSTSRTSTSRTSTSRTPTSPLEQKNKKKKANDSIASVMEKAATILADTTQPQAMDTVDAFAIMISNDLKTIKNQQRFRTLRRNIQDLIDRALEEEEEEEEQ